MKLGKIFLMTLLLLAVLTIGCVSASDDANIEDSDLAADSNAFDAVEQADDGEVINVDEASQEDIVLKPLATSDSNNNVLADDATVDCDDYYYDDFDDDYPKMSVKIKAPALTVKYKANKYFKITIKDSDGYPVIKEKVVVKISNGKKVKKFNLYTNSKGIIKIKTNKLKVGKYKVKITLKDSDSYYDKTVKSKITVKKPKPSKYKIITTTAEEYSIFKKSGNFKVETIIYDMTAGFMEPYKYIDTFLYKNGKMVYNNKYFVKYKVDGVWSGWTRYTTSTSHHRHSVPDDADVQKIMVLVNKNVKGYL